jgi:hypothetical protein
MSEHDRLGLLYALLEQEHGEYMGIRFARVGPSGDPEWMDLPHRQFDGIGGLWELHRRVYGAEGAGPMPALCDAARPGLIETFWLFLRLMARPRVALASWRSYDPSWQGTSPEHSRPDNTSWRTLTEEQTAALLGRARARTVSANSLLLWALGRAVEPELSIEEGPVRWMVPVNMRGAITRPRATANHSSYVRADTPPGGSVQELDRAIRSALAQKEHFAAWCAFSIGPLLGARYMRRVLAAEIRDGIPWAGMFSNLGAWPERTDGRGAEDTWIFCPPVSRLQPLGAGAVTFGGRLTLALQAHPTLRASQEKVARWLDTWLGEAAAIGPLPGNQT